jgi:hypothetical protein
LGVWPAHRVPALHRFGGEERHNPEHAGKALVVIVFPCSGSPAHSGTRGTVSAERERRRRRYLGRSFHKVRLDLFHTGRINRCRIVESFHLLTGRAANIQKQSSFPNPHNALMSTNPIRSNVLDGWIMVGDH